MSHFEEKCIEEVKKCMENRKLISDCCYAPVVRNNLTMRYKCLKCGSTCMVKPEPKNFKRVKA